MGSKCDLSNLVPVVCRATLNRVLRVQVLHADKQTATEPTVYTGLDQPNQPQQTGRMHKSNIANVATKDGDSVITSTRLAFQGEASKADSTGETTDNIKFEVAPKKKKSRGRPVGSKNKKQPAGANA